MKRDPAKAGPDERIFGRHYRGPSPARSACVVAILIADPASTSRSRSRSRSPARATSSTRRSRTRPPLKPDSPVRIAGVNVGKVTIGRAAKGNMAKVTFTVDDEGLPIHKDATITIRPRLFLEGNFFLDLAAGEPERPRPLERAARSR